MILYFQRHIRVYLDFNIYASIEAGEFTMESVSEKLNTQEIVNVFYSAAHIYETDNITAPCQEIRKERILKRLDTIRMITKNMYLFHKLPSNNVRLLNENPIGIYNTITESIDVITLHPDGKSFGLHNRIAGIFELLDMFDYGTDQYTYKSNVARLWDSNHCYFASFCDDFISNDKRTRNKAKVVYNL